jgi:hypothetical protein
VVAKAAGGPIGARAVAGDVRCRLFSAEHAAEMNFRFRAAQSNKDWPLYAVPPRYNFRTFATQFTPKRPFAALPRIDAMGGSPRPDIGAGCRAEAGEDGTGKRIGIRKGGIEAWRSRAGCHFRQYVSGKAILSIDSRLSRLFDHQLDLSSMAGVVSHVAGAVSGPVIGNSSITWSHPVT